MAVFACRASARSPVGLARQEVGRIHMKNMRSILSILILRQLDLRVPFISTSTRGVSYHHLTRGKAKTSSNSKKTALLTPRRSWLEGHEYPLCKLGSEAAPEIARQRGPLGRECVRRPCVGGCWWRVALGQLQTGPATGSGTPTSPRPAGHSTFNTLG